MNTIKLKAHKGLTKQSHFAAIKAKKTSQQKRFFCRTIKCLDYFCSFFWHLVLRINLIKLKQAVKSGTNL